MIRLGEAMMILELHRQGLSVMAMNPTAGEPFPERPRRYRPPTRGVLVPSVTKVGLMSSGDMASRTASAEPLWQGGGAGNHDGEPNHAPDDRGASSRASPPYACRGRVREVRRRAPHQ